VTNRCQLSPKVRIPIRGLPAAADHDARSHQPAA
jgi:hypothetical protein